MSTTESRYPDEEGSQCDPLEPENAMVSMDGQPPGVAQSLGSPNSQGGCFPALVGHAITLATLAVAIATGWLAWATYEQVKASKLSIANQDSTIAQQTTALEMFRTALTEFRESIDIARANQESLEKIARASRDQADSSKESLKGEVKLVRVGGSCQLQQGDSTELFSLQRPRNCDFVQVIIRNTGKVPLKAYAAISFIGIDAPLCRSESLDIPGDDEVLFPVHVDLCLGERPTGQEVPDPVKFHVTAERATS